MFDSYIIIACITKSQGSQTHRLTHLSFFDLPKWNQTGWSHWRNDFKF